MNAILANLTRGHLPMNSFSREMNRWIDDVTTDTQTAGEAPVSIWESETHYFLEFDLPGVVAENVDIKIVENVLHVSANRPSPNDETFLRQERRFGSVERRFSMPERIDEDQIEAELNSGVLKISVAKAPEAQVKTIEIKSS